MTINPSDIPAYNPYAGVGGTAPTPPVNPVDDPNLSPQEATTQAACYLAYLYNLSLDYIDPGPDDKPFPEIQRVCKIIEDYLKEGKIQDPQMKEIIEQKLSVLAPGGNVTDSSIWNYYSDFKTNNPMGDIEQWLTDEGYPSASSSPDTMFAFLMFMNVAANPSISSSELNQKALAFFNQGDPSSGYPTCAQYASEFLVVYLKTHTEISESTVVNAIAFGDQDFHDTFADSFSPYGWASWQPPYPGASLPKVLQAYMQEWVDAYFPGPSGAESFIKL